MKHLKFVGALLGLSLAAASASADERLFGFVDEADVLPKGGLEFEQWVTHKLGAASGIYSRFDFRQELEIGLTDKLSTALVLNSKAVYESVYDDVLLADVNTEEVAFEGFGTELKYQLLSPSAGPVGVLAYGELSYNGPELEAEAKLILEHNLSEKLEWAADFIVENEYVYEASRQSVNGISEFSTGLAYRVAPEYSVGLEARNHREWPDNWGYQASSAWFVGPNLHAEHEKWWATLAVCPQLSGQPESISGDGRDLTSHNKVESRLLFGINF